VICLCGECVGLTPSYNSICCCNRLSCERQSLSPLNSGPLLMNSFSKNSPTMLRFGPFELRPQARELYKHGIKVRLRPQPFKVLHFLLDRAGTAVTREELHQELWPSDTFVDFQHGLNTTVKELRGALGDSATEPRYIETLPRLGYRIIVSVEVEPLPTGGTAVASYSPPTPSEYPAGGKNPEESFPPLARSRRWALFLPVAVLLLAVSGFWFQSYRSRLRPLLPEGRVMLAILPFANLTGDESQEYFSDGLTEEMIAQLGRLDPEHLGVIARTSVMHYKNSPEQISQIGRELGVQYVLEGSVRRDADKVRITAQLIQVKDQSHLWSRQYDRELRHLLTLQGEIAQEISGEIQPALGQPVKSSSSARLSAPPAPKNYEAYDLYLKGRYYWNKRTGPGFEQAIQCFHQAIAKDPTYARAYAGLADSYALISAYYLASPSEAIPKARAAALKALELDKDLADAHVSLALIAQNYDWDWQTSEKEFRRAIALDPNYATAHHWYAEHLAFLGRFNEAFPEMQLARELDPLSLIMRADNAVLLYYARQYDRAIQQFRTVSDLDPNFPRAHMICYAYVQQARFADALADIEVWRRIEPGYWADADEVYVYGRQGKPDQARRAFDNFQRSSRGQPIDPFVSAGPYLGLGDTDQVLAALEKSVTAHSPGLTALKVDPIFDPLRKAPRFQSLLNRVGLGSSAKY
jgi:TolB-like protein/DNA-binding winged helix-turn-helix (wHTH) protein